MSRSNESNYTQTVGHYINKDCITAPKPLTTTATPLYTYYANRSFSNITDIHFNSAVQIIRLSDIVDTATAIPDQQTRLLPQALLD